MKITTFLSVNNGTEICIVYKGVKVAPKQRFQKYVLSYYSLVLNPRNVDGLLLNTYTVPMHP